MNNNSMPYRRWWLCFLLLAWFAPSHALSTQADSSSVEWIKTYFNMPADYSVAAPGNMSNSSSDLIGSLETLIDGANHSIDLAIYDLEHQRHWAKNVAKIASQCCN